MGDNIFVKIIFFLFLLIFIGIPNLVLSEAFSYQARVSGMALAVFCIYGFVVGCKNRKTIKGKIMIILSFLSWLVLGFIGLTRVVI